MDKEDIKQTLLLSFIVAFILEFVSWIREMELSWFRLKYGTDLPGINHWLLFILVYLGLILTVIGNKPNLLKIEDKELIENIKKAGFWIFLISTLLLFVFTLIFIK